MRLHHPVTALLTILALTSCARGDRERQISECADIQRTMYITGQVRDCLVQRFGWKAEEATRIEQERMSGAHPDSASAGDSGRMGK
jgi:hypothetical protein